MCEVVSTAQGPTSGACTHRCFWLPPRHPRCLPLSQGKAPIPLPAQAGLPGASERAPNSDTQGMGGLGLVAGTPEDFLPSWNSPRWGSQELRDHGTRPKADKQGDPHPQTLSTF